MHTSGIHVSESLKHEFADARIDPNCLYLTFNIKNDAFEKIGHGVRHHSGSGEADFAEIQKALKDDKPAYVVARAPNNVEKWILIFFMPEGSTVRDRMVYASSLNLLKDGLGTSYFLSAGFNISKKEECTLKEYEENKKETNEHEILTSDELMKMESETASHLAMGNVKVSAIMDLPIKSSEDTLAAIQSVGNKSVSTVILYLDQQTELLLSEKKGNFNFDQITSFLSTSEPRFVLQSFPHEQDGKPVHAFVFIYYCPEDCKPRLKMMYSSSKAFVIKLCDKCGVQITKNIELSEMKEINEGSVMDELYPQVSVKKQFKKAAKPGKGKARLTAGTKFQA